MATRRGDTLLFQKPPTVAAFAAVGGKKEGEGPLAAGFDRLFEDNLLEQETWEQAESLLQRQCLDVTLSRAGITEKELSLVLAGDLQNQCAASSYTLREVDVPYVGVYGACSTMAETLGLGACLASAGLVDRVAALTSSHFCTAERQFRTPLEYGGKRTPTSQWTATAAGCCLLEPTGKGPFVRAVTFGRVKDLEITDVNNMGAAMAPAAASTILHYCRDCGAKPADFDAVYTGDLGVVGSKLLVQLLENEGIQLTNHQDCGLMLYDRENQNVQAGASGAGCSAAVLCGHILPRLRTGQLRRVLFLSTGALMSKTTCMQGQSIPGVAHLLELSAKEDGQ